MQALGSIPLLQASQNILSAKTPGRTPKEKLVYFSFFHFHSELSILIWFFSKTRPFF